MPWRSLRAACKVIVSRKVELTVEGAEHLPERGPAIIAAHHVHHLYDGAAILATSARPVHIVVTVDWIDSPLGRRAMELLCRSARWPAVVRTDPFARQRKPYDPFASRALFRRAVADVVALTREGRLVLMFPEGYPNIDPNATPKTRDDELLPFQPGFVRFARIAERSGARAVPIVPAGLIYERGNRWKLNLRYGPPIAAAGPIDEVRQRAEAAVRALSGLPA